MSDCTSTTSTRFDTRDFDSLRIGERDVFRDVTSDAADLVGVGGAGRIGRERLGCTGITQGPRSLRAVARLPPVPPRCNLLELSAIMMRGSGKERNLQLDFFFRRDEKTDLKISLSYIRDTFHRGAGDSSKRFCSNAFRNYTIDICINIVMQTKNISIYFNDICNRIIFLI